MDWGWRQLVNYQLVGCLLCLFCLPKLLLWPLTRIVSVTSQMIKPNILLSFRSAHSCLGSLSRSHSHSCFCFCSPSHCHCNTIPIPLALPSPLLRLANWSTGCRPRFNWSKVASPCDPLECAAGGWGSWQTFIYRANQLSLRRVCAPLASPPRHSFTPLNHCARCHVESRCALTESNGKSFHMLPTSQAHASSANLWQPERPQQSDHKLDRITS